MVVIRAGQSVISFPTPVPGSVVLSEQKTGLCLTFWGVFKFYFSLHRFFSPRLKGHCLDFLLLELVKIKINKS